MTQLGPTIASWLGLALPQADAALPLGVRSSR
jgi:hypothetical protein